MAITRCPYCHAIIDENDKYCNNCGTQLLFPEDDEVDEEIPGEKIVDAEVEEKDYTVEEPEDEKSSRAAKDAEEDLDEELEEEMREEEAEKALDELVAEEELEEEAAGATEEVILVDETEASEAEEKAATGEIEKTVGPNEEEGTGGEKKEETEEEDEEEETEEAGEKEEGAEEEEDKEEEPVVEYLTGPSEESEGEDLAAATAGESALRPVTFDSKELDNLGRTVELSKEKIEKFIQVLAEKKPAVTPETAEIAVAPAPAPPETAPASPPPATPAPGPGPGGVRESTGNLPPWASTMKGAPVFPPDTTPVEPKKGPAAPSSTDEEVEIFPRRKPSDSSIGLPERLSQAPLPFGEEEHETEEEAGAEEKAEEETREMVTPSVEPEGPSRPPILPVREPGRAEAAVLEEAEAPAERPPFSFSVFFKSKAFDVLFVGLFWLVALWLAAHAMGQTLFEVLGTVSGPMLLLYAVFVLLYFFLFKFFLGETLGDRLFRRRD